MRTTHWCVAILSALAAFATAALATPRAETVVRGYLAARSPAAKRKWLAPDYRYWFLSHDGPGETAGEHLNPGWDSELNGTLRADSVGVDGARVTARVHEDNDFSRLIDHPGWNARVSFTLDDRGRIATEFYEPLPGAPPWRPYLEHSLPWLRQHRSRELGRVLHDGKLVQTRAAAREWRSVLRAWRAAGSPDRALAR